jgi:Na+/melibiose symporter-like transporter
MRVTAQHRNFRYLTGLYLAGRVAMDLVGAMLILYFTHYIGRSADFERSLLLFLTAAAVSLPLWLRVSQHGEKLTLFRIGCVWWIGAQLFLLVAGPHWPSWSLLAFAPLAAIGYAVVDLMPWSMLGDVIDEDDVRTGERREGVYHGVFLFLRKLGGAAAVFLALGVLDLVGFAAHGEQSQRTLTAIRLMASVGPALFLVLALWFSRGYLLTRAQHGAIHSTLVERERKSVESSVAGGSTAPKPALQPA